jgi:hypothetical protein
MVTHSRELDRSRHMTAWTAQFPKLMVQPLSPIRRVGHSWDAAQPSIELTSVTAGHAATTDLSRGGL